MFKMNMNFSVVVVMLILCCYGAAFAQPSVLEAGVSSSQKSWRYTMPMEPQEVKFWMRAQRQGNLSKYGTFDYYFKVQVFRPDGSKVWDTIYGFDEQGYAEQIFTLPALFYERSVDKSSPSFGTWKIITELTEKESGRKVVDKEYSYVFVDGR